MAKQSMRELMPTVAQWVDQLRELIGREAADRIVRDGMRGTGAFWARECGPDGQWREIGSRPTARRPGP